MANTKSNLKRIRSTKRKTAHNDLVTSRVRGALKRTRQALASSDEQAPLQVKNTLSILDRAVSKGVLHKNNAARRKSRLMRALNRQAPSAP